MLCHEKTMIQRTEDSLSGGSWVDSWSLWGRLGPTLGGSWGDFGGSEGGQGGSEEGQGRPPAAEFFFHFRRFKIMKLCQNLNLLWKRLEID